MPFAAHADSQGSDWLIERWNGQWQLVYKGATGRVEKTALNQEVLRLGEGGVVQVLTAPAADSNGAAYCGGGQRYDYRSTCSSGFLDCRKDPAGLYISAIGAVFGYSLAESRTRLACRLDGNAVLRAAEAVGMISTVLPVADK